MFHDARQAILSGRDPLLAATATLQVNSKLTTNLGQSSSAKVSWGQQLDALHPLPEEPMEDCLTAELSELLMEEDKAGNKPHEGSELLISDNNVDDDTFPAPLDWAEKLSPMGASKRQDWGASPVAVLDICM